MTSGPRLLENDGVAAVLHGDVLLCIWNAPARLRRSRWAYDVTDELARRNPDGILGLMLILPSADPPDGPARAENAKRMRTLAPSIRRLVTVAVGDSLWVSVVRAVMRATCLFQGQRKFHMVATTLDEGMRLVLDKAGPQTPSRGQLEQDLRQACQALGVSAADIGLTSQEPPRAQA